MPKAPQLYELSEEWLEGPCPRSVGHSPPTRSEARAGDWQLAQGSWKLPQTKKSLLGGWGVRKTHRGLEPGNLTASWMRELQRRGGGGAPLKSEQLGSGCEGDRSEGNGRHMQLAATQPPLGLQHLSFTHAPHLTPTPLTRERLG